MKSPEGLLVVALLICVFMAGSGRGENKGRKAAEVTFLVTVETLVSTADARHERFAQCIRRLYNAGFPAEHDPVQLCEDQQ